jgi:cell division protein FtsQ
MSRRTPAAAGQTAILGQASPAVATDRRFRRAHVKPGRKKSPTVKYAWLATRVIAMLMIVGYAAYVGVTTIAEASTLQIGHMSVRGNKRLATGEVLALVEGLRGQNILSADLDAWQQKLLASPWVERATIRRVLPSTLEIAIYERVPMGIGRIGTALYLVDARGVIIDEYGPAYADIDLPIIDGLASSPRDGGPIVNGARAEFAARVIAALSARPEIARTVSQIDVSNLHDAIVILDGDTAVLRLGDADFLSRLQQYIDLAPALRERLTAIDYVDLRFDERLYVRPPKSAQAKK